MESKDIRELIELVSRSNFTTFELEREGFKLRLVKEPVAGPPLSAASSPPVGAAALGTSPPAAVASPDPGDETADGLYDMNAPIVGTFFRAAGPDAASFVEVGDRVKKGQVMCIVEAMKVMNEIEAEIDAEVIEINIANGQPVEFGEVLFRLRPLN